MIKNYLLTALRSFAKNRFYTFINIVGLSIGAACSILILLWVVDELTYDRFIPKSDRLFQLWVNSDFDNKINSWRSVPLPTYEALKSIDNNIKNTVVTDWGGHHLLTFGEKKLIMKGHYVSEEFLEMFEFPLIYGDASVVLDDPSSIVITESTAKAFFGDTDPLNQVIRVDDKGELKVTGILRDPPKNSSFEFDYLLPWKYRRQIIPWVKDNEDNWGNYSFQVFVELSNSAYADEVNESIKLVLQEHGEVDLKPELFLYPMERWRLYSNFENGKEKGGMSDFVQLFGLIAVFIIIIACINFMNLSTARSEKRAKEVGIRKSVGSHKFHLVFQFLSESMIISFFACVLAVLFAQLALPFYNDLVEKELFINYKSWEFWVVSFGLALMIGFVSGSYPAFYLSSFQPIRVLKGSIQQGRRASWPRKILVTFQFAISIFLIIATMLIYEQIRLVKNRQLGYNQQNLITIDLNDELKKNYRALKTELLQSNLVESTTISNSPVTEIHSNNFLGWPGKPEEQRVLFTTITCQYDYAKTMGVKILEGRDFSEDFVSDSSAIIVNKAAMDLMKLEDPLGTELELWGGKRTLIGVIDNILMGSPYREVKPLFMIMDDWGGYITLRISATDNLQASLKGIEKIYKKYNPAYPFDYEFADVEFQEKFATIEMTNTLAGVFASLAICITGLGLFGLAAFTAEQRTKEIGVRKVLGATVFSIISLISRDFSKLVIIAFVVTAPLAWWLLNMYLDRYPVRIDIQFWIFPVTGFIVLSFALFIVTSQALKAAHVNPANTLKDE
ncbi:MAG: ABC transporter permease [Cytophagales bacterium]|nr:ABC transporter permease [Cytophagales bacterium]